MGTRRWELETSYMGRGGRQSHMFDFYRVQFMMQDYFFTLMFEKENGNTGLHCFVEEQ